jgi:hypothetical protein
MQYSQPKELPAGYLEMLQPLSVWLMRQLVTAYDDGYSAGRADERLLAMRRAKLPPKI